MHRGGQRLARNLVRRIDAQAIGVILLEPHARVRDNQVADLLLPGGEPGSPGRTLTPLEEHAALARHSVELPEAVVDVTQVIPDDVEEHRESVVVRRAHQATQVERRSERRLRREQVRRPVSLVAVAGILMHRQQRDRIEPE